MFEAIIIGAGISGLKMAKFFSQNEIGPTLVLEKSKGLGGRIATRRTLGTKFDHGAQFYRLKNEILDLHQGWQTHLVSHQWFVSSMGNHWCAAEGMTALAKNLGKKQNIVLEKLVKSIEFNSEENKWIITSDKDEVWFSKKIILTAPLPQSLILLEKSGINYPEELKSIQYTKAVIGLLTLEESFSLDGAFGYQEFSQGDFFSISDQMKKGVSSIPAMTVTMSSAFSEAHFDLEDEIVMKKILESFRAHYPQARIKDSELKKWRYCQALSTYIHPYARLDNGLFLIGDAFSGASLLGSIRSAEALSADLLESHINSF
jgi:renalase